MAGMNNDRFESCSQFVISVPRKEKDNPPTSLDDILTLLQALGLLKLVFKKVESCGFTAIASAGFLVSW